MRYRDWFAPEPLGLLERVVEAHSSPGGMLMDFFAGSGTFGEAAARHGRSCLLVDNNPEAVRIMTRRLARFGPEVEGVEGDCGAYAEPGVIYR